MGQPVNIIKFKSLSSESLMPGQKHKYDIWIDNRSLADYLEELARRHQGIWRRKYLMVDIETLKQSIAKSGNYPILVSTVYSDPSDADLNSVEVQL
jgi:hypothetical protein